MFGNLLIALLVLSVLILVHELGHFFVAKKNGIWVEEFGIGLPPRIWGKKIKDTIYSINLLPFGGFCRMHGENSTEDIVKPTKSFLGKGKWVRIKVITAGVVMNFILAVIAFAITYSVMGVPKDTGKVKILEVSPSSPAQTAGLLVGDVIDQVEGEKVSAVDSFLGVVSEKKGERLSLTVQRQTGEYFEEKKINLIPRENPPENEGPLGVTISTTEVYFPPVWQRPFVGVFYGFKEAVFWGKNILESLGDLIKGLFGGQVPEGLAGPVGIFAVTSEAAKYGWLSLLNFAGILSVNLAILNILPFPALDGGRLVFVFLESIIGKKILPKIEATVHTIGIIILLSLILLITVQDVRNLIASGSFSGYIESMVK